MLRVRQDSPSPQEIDRKIRRSEWWLKFNYASIPPICWLFTFGSTLAVWQSSFPELWLGWVGTCSLFSLAASAGSRHSLKIFERHKALFLWDYLGNRLGRRIPAKTKLFGTRVSHMYQQDPQAEHFPLRQAIRVIDIYHRHQQRLEQLSKRLNELSLLQSQLQQKIARLQQLGDEHETGKRSLLQFDEDIATLRAIRDKIEASCQRLEILAISMQRSSEIRQLNHEINSIAAHVASPVPSLGTHDEDLADIERQIGREIETYLHLERETDKHLQ